MQFLKLLEIDTKKIKMQQFYEKYQKAIGQMIHAEIYRKEGGKLFVYDNEKNDLILPEKERIAKEEYKIGQYIYVIVSEVIQREKKVLVIVSRTSPCLIEKLFEREIPEVFDELITIKKVVRIPGVRTKVVVQAEDDRIDPVGACIGMRGMRIKSIMQYVCNEQIDIINYTDNLELYISRLLSPAKVSNIKQSKIDDTIITVYVPADTIALAIGSKGQNIYLANQLMGDKSIIIRKKLYGDIYLDELIGEIDESVIDELKLANLETVKGVLTITKQELSKQVSLGKEVIDNLYQTLEKVL
jgi:N utilization substance protein A